MIKKNKPARQLINLVVTEVVKRENETEYIHGTGKEMLSFLVLLKMKGV